MVKDHKKHFQTASDRKLHVKEDYHCSFLPCSSMLRSVQPGQPCDTYIEFIKMMNIYCKLLDGHYHIDNYILRKKDISAGITE